MSTQEWAPGPYDYEAESPPPDDDGWSVEQMRNEQECRDKGHDGQLIGICRRCCLGTLVVEL